MKIPQIPKAVAIGVATRDEGSLERFRVNQPDLLKAAVAMSHNDDEVATFLALGMLFATTCLEAMPDKVDQIAAICNQPDVVTGGLKCLEDAMTKIRKICNE